MPLGETAEFMCVGEGLFAFWTVNGQPDNVPASKERGVKVINDYTNPPVLSTSLTIPGTMENDNVPIQCSLIRYFYTVYTVYSPVVHPTVLGKLCRVDE